MLTRQHVGFGLAVCFTLALSGCGGSGSDNNDTGGGFRIAFHGINAAPDIREKVNFEAEDSRFARSLGYLEVGGGLVKQAPVILFTAWTDQTGELLAHWWNGVPDDHIGYVVVCGRRSENLLRFFAERIAAPDPGTVRVAVLHNLRMVGNVDIWMYPKGAPRPSAATFPNVRYGYPINFETVVSGTYALEVTLANSPETILEAEVDAVSKASYIVMATPRTKETEIGAIIPVKVR